MIEFRVLGTLGLTADDGREIRSLLSQPKRLALFTFLTIARPHGFHRRDTLLGLFWAESDEIHARNALRQALHYLRRSLGPDVVVSRGEDELGINFERVRCDVPELTARLGAGEFERGLELYAGDLLPGFYIEAAARFEHWLGEERDHLRRRAAGAALELSRLAETGDDLAGAVTWARRRAEILPHDEDVLRDLLRLLDQSGNGVAAVREYEAFSERCAREDGSQPSAETRALAATIRQRTDKSADRPPIATSTRGNVRRTRPWWPLTQQGAVIATLAGVGAVALFAGVLGLLRRDGRPPTGAVPTQRQVTFAGNVVEARASPRGEFLAYTTDDAEGAKLMVLDLETGSDIEIASRPDFIGLPDWSPDGRQILVGSGVGLDFAHLAYPRLGGDPRTIPTSPGRSRWSADGLHMFHWGQGGREIRMSPIGSESHVRIRTSDTTAWINDVVPHPGGRVLALLHTPPAGPGSSIWQLTIDGAPGFAGLPRDSAGRIVPVGNDRLVESESDIYSTVWSPMGDFLYYLTETEGTFDLWRLPTTDDGTARRESELLASGIELGAPARPWESLLSVSEDGSKLFFVRGRRFSNLWSMRATDDAWNVEQLTTGTTIDVGASASPNGEWVAYSSTVGGRTNLFLVPSTGGPPRQLTHLESVSGYPAWSPDGSSLAFGLRRADGNFVATVQVDGPPRLRVYEATRLSGNATITWAPGPEILYQRPGLRDFHFLDPDTEAERPLSSADSTASGFYLSAHYSPDASRLVVRVNRQPTSRAGLYVTSLDGGSERQLASGPYAAAIGWSEDGEIVYTLSEDRRQLMAVPADGGPPFLVSQLPFEADRLATTFDGRWFVFAAARATGDVWSIEGFDVDP